MRSTPLPCLVVFVANVSRITEFYRELCQMALVHADESHSVLELEGFQLVIHALHGEPDPAPGREGSLAIREDSYLKICLPVESISNARTRALGFGGFVKPQEAEWEARGFRACDGHDPEGNVFQVRQIAT